MKFRAPCVLLVDADTSACTFISSSLRNLGCKTLTACNGEEALRLLSNRPYIDVIVTDVELPVISGLEFLRILRKNHRFQQLPFIFFSASVDEVSMKTAVEYRCGRYLLKPVHPEFLFEQISSLLDQKALRADVQGARA